MTTTDTNTNTNVDGNDVPARRSLAVAPALPAARTVARPAAGPVAPLGVLGRLGVLLVAAGLAGGVLAGLGWFSAHLEGWRTTIGPDHTQTARGAAEAAACDVIGATYSQWRCVLYLQEDTATEARRTPRTAGGDCPLGTRYACAKRYGLTQQDQDVPIWAPWDLYNARPAIALNATGGGVVGLAAVALAVALGAIRRCWWRVLAAGAGAAVAGSVGAVGLFSLGRHTVSEAGVTGALPAWAVPVAALTAVLAVRRRARRAGGAS